MYGMINVAIRDLVNEKFGNESWKKICKEVNLEDDQYKYLEYYPDHITISLVGAASKVLSIPADVILKEFGAYWIKHTAQMGYGPIMDLFGADFITCLKNLNNMHARMGLNMPNLKPPRFEVRDLGNHIYDLEYFSTRRGLEPMVMGLITGLAEKYNVNIQATNISLSPEESPQKFKIQILS